MSNSNIWDNAHDGILQAINTYNDISDIDIIIRMVNRAEEQLIILLKLKLVPSIAAKDDLLEGIDATIITFSSKIELAFRLGLLNEALYKDLLIIRKIRQLFALDNLNCSYSKDVVKARIDEFNTHPDRMPLYNFINNINGQQAQPRAVFIFVALKILDYLEKLQGSIVTLRYEQETGPHSLGNV